MQRSPFLRLFFLSMIALLSGCSETTSSGVPVGPVWVTLAYLVLYYGFLTKLMFVKIRLSKEYKERGEKFDRYFGQDREMLAADRTQLNMLEHMPVFLILLWLHGIIGEASEATFAGALYVGMRAMYPLLLGSRLGRGLPMKLFFVTFGAYAVCLFMAVRIAMALLGT